MKQVDSIALTELEAMSRNMYDELVKAVVDVERRLLVVDAGLHADEEQYLLDHGSSQQDLWGVNLYPDCFGEDDFIEFDSMINIRPAQGNRSRSVEDEATQELIRQIIMEAVHG